IACFGPAGWRLRHSATPRPATATTVIAASSIIKRLSVMLRSAFRAAIRSRNEQRTVIAACRPMRNYNQRIDPALRTAYIARHDGVTMAIREIIKLPDKRLRLLSEPVKQIDAGIRKLVDDMFETMYKAPGIGLAAIQVGVAKRVITMDLSKKEDNHE